MNPNRKILARNPRNIHSYLKDLSDVVKNIISRIDFFENKKVIDEKEYVKLN